MRSSCSKMLLLCKQNEKIILNRHLLTGAAVANHYETTKLTIVRAKRKMSVRMCMVDAHGQSCLESSSFQSFHPVMRRLRGPSRTAQKTANHQNILFPRQSYIAYPLEQMLMVPFKRQGAPLTWQQRQSLQTRKEIERAFEFEYSAR